MAFSGKRLNKVKTTVTYLNSLDIPVQSANSSFFLILSLFPMLVLLLSLVRFTGLDPAYLTDLMEGYVPKALMPTVEQLIMNTYRNSTNTLVSLSALIALWSASHGMVGLIKGMNVVYQTKDDRNYLYVRVLSIFYTLVFVLMLMLTIGLNVFGATLVEHYPMKEHPFLEFLAEIIHLRFFLLLALQTVMFTTMYMVFPNRRNKLIACMPGALISAIGWMVFTELYSQYVTSFTTYSSIFGPVYALALSMLWLYCCISIVFYGGALNHYLVSK